jgi:hypothetical protein
VVLPALRDSCLLFVACLLLFGMDQNCNFSAMRSPIELKLGGDLGLVSQISVHVLVSSSTVFHIVNKEEEKIAEIAKTRFLENLSFLRSCKFN